MHSYLHDKDLFKIKGPSRKKTLPIIKPVNEKKKKRYTLDERLAATRTHLGCSSKLAGGCL